MSLTRETYQLYLDILTEELIPALGCTEPIAISYAAAKAREVLGCMPEHIKVRCSGNIVKNVKGVVVPNTGNLKGINASAIAGTVGGDASKVLEVLTVLTPDDIAKTKDLLKTDFCKVELWEDAPANLAIDVEAFGEGHHARVVIVNAHTNIVRLEKDGEVLFEKPVEKTCTYKTDRSKLNVKDILEFADTLNVEDVRDLFSRQIAYNTAISKEGLTHSYGTGVGATLLKFYGDQDVRIRAKAAAAAGSDARMSGCDLPVVINSGSGNQGMTVSLPVVEYAKELDVGEEKLFRALAVSNLVALHQKTQIGSLSAYCGAVCAAVGSGAAITYLHGGSYEDISRTIINTLGDVAGIVCDGAKPSCASKIASAVDAAILGHTLAMDGKAFAPGEGLIKDDVEQTIASVGRLGKEGMKETDVEVLKIMLDE